MIKCFIHPEGDVISNPVCELHELWKPGFALTSSELEAFAKECYERGQRSVGWRDSEMSRIDELFETFWAQRKGRE